MSWRARCIVCQGKTQKVDESSYPTTAFGREWTMTEVHERCTLCGREGWVSFCDDPELMKLRKRLDPVALNNDVDPLAGRLKRILPLLLILFCVELRAAVPDVAILGCCGVGGD